MSPTLRITGIVVVLAGLGWLGWRPVRSMYLGPRVEVEQRRAKLIADVNRYRSGVDDGLRLRTELQAYADRTLGGDLEAVDHELRTRLNRIGEEVGLKKLSVGTGRVRSMETPARNVAALRANKELRDELDFVEVEASVSGVGSLEAAMRLVHRIEAEGWIKRIVQVRLQPRDNGERFVVTIRLVTLYLPGRAPAGPVETVADLGGFERYQPLVRRNPFRLAAKPVAAAPQPVAPKPAGQHRKWVLTGVVSGPDGVEVWLLHADSGQSRRLSIGQSIQGVRLVAAAGDTADFEFGEDRFTVPVGRPLAPKRP